MDDLRPVVAACVAADVTEMYQRSREEVEDVFGMYLAFAYDVALSCAESFEAS